MSYAIVHDIPYRRRGSLYSGDQLIEHVPRLAICLNLGKDIGPLLFHCDEAWNMLGTSGATTIAGVKNLAERNYPGVAARWVDVNTSVEDAFKCYDEQTVGLKCSYCGKRPFEIEGGLVQGTEAAICRSCVDDFHQAFKEQGD